ncbi:beta-lactamase/transpeptidase-like protein [Flagelloscypha sp. PMI_526]|nr:beta-lactamase/transpeptidase-like protein [Flagelloscypha sp. PMI_526]
MKMYYLLYFVLPFLSTATCLILDQEEFTTFVDDLLTEWNVPGGASIAFVQQNDSSSSNHWVVETAGFGNATKYGDRMTADSQMCIASNSKLFTVFLVGIALDDQKARYPLRFKTKICSLIPDWCTMHERLEYPLNQNTDYFRDLKHTATEATIEDLMSHRTGWPRHDNSWKLSLNASNLLSHHLPNLRRSATFREEWQYNNFMYATLSFLPSIIWGTDDSFLSLVEKHIFEPLALNETTWDRNQLIHGFSRVGDFPRPSAEQGTPSQEDVWEAFTQGKPLVWPPEVSVEGDIVAGAGGVISSARDMATWLQMLLLKGKNPTTGEQVIPSWVVDAAATGLSVAVPHSPYPEMSPVVYGGGQMIGTYRGHQYIEHGGSTPGFMTQVIRFPNTNFGVAVLANDDIVGSQLHDIIKWRAVDTVLGLEPLDWNTRMKNVLYQVISARPAITPRPTDPTLPLPSTSFEGTYTNPSYGTVRLCLLNSTLPSCKTFLSTLPTHLPGIFPENPDPDSPPTLISTLENVYSAYMIISHYEGAVWNLTSRVSVLEEGKRTAVNLFGGLVTDGVAVEFGFEPETTNSSRTKSFAYGGREQEVMVSSDGGYHAPLGVKGFGLTGIWGAGASVPPLTREGNVVERSEVWFSKDS